MCGDDMEVFKRASLAFKETMAKKRAAERPRVPKPAVPVLAAPDEPRRPLDMPHDRGCTQGEAKVYFPPGMSLRKDEKHNQRWLCTAPYLFSAVTKTWGVWTGLDQNQALLFCVQAVWAMYSAHTGERCPWDLGAAF